ncbi:MAG TPA: hypothetical protein VFV08_04660 [Puia sp.]|nr:hypothetical protein [Puia sp.]
MGKGAKAFLITAIVAFTLIGGYILLKKKNAPLTKEQQAEFLSANGFSQGSVQWLMSLGDDYIGAWYNAAKAGQKSFVLSGSTYSVSGGEAIPNS